MAQLEYPTGDHPPVPLDDEIVIGRSADHASLAIDDKRLSRKHCRIFRENDAYIIEDLESRNGVKVNDKPIKRSALKDGDEISLGGLKLRFSTGDGGSEPAFADTLNTKVKNKTESEAPPTTVPSLKLLKGTLRSVLIPLDNLPITFGRKPGNTIVLEDDKQASSRHARFERNEDGDIVLVDLQSTNGTKVNGQRIEQMVLEDGARIHIGSQIFRFSLPGSDSGIKLEDDDADVGEQVDDVKDVELESRSTPEKTDDDKAPAENEEERIAKIEVDTAGTGRGKLLVRIMEIAGALVVLGAIGAFVVLAGKETTAGPGGVGGSDNTLPVLPGGLLAKNPSFETDGKPGSEGRINHWQSLVTAREDSVVGVADSGKGGRQVMRVERFTQSRSRTFWVCREPFFVPQSGGFDVSVWAKTPRDGASAFLFVEWFVSEEDILPMRRDCRGYTSGLSNWTQITSTFVPPTGARLGRMGVGVTGRAGVVLFDQAKVVKNEAAKPFALASGNPLQVKLSDDGTLAFLDQRGGKASPMLSSVAIELTTPSMAGITVPHHEWLVDAPVAEARDGKLSITFHVFDPESEKARDITVVCDGKIAISASDPLGSSLSALRLVGAASDRFLPSGVVVLQDGRPLHWGREVTSNVAQMVRCADTQNRYAFSADTHVMLSGGTLSFLSHSPEIGVTFHLADYDDNLYKNLLATATGTQAAPLQQMLAALELLASHPFDEQPAVIAVQAFANAANACRVKQIELNDLVTHGSTFAGSEDLFLRSVTNVNEWRVALDEAIASSDRTISANNLGDSLNSPRSHAKARDAFAKIIASLESLRATRDTLAAIGAKGEQARLKLLATRQQLESESKLASALDHLASAEFAQAELKLRSIVRDYPYSYSATVARARLLDVARNLLADYLDKRSANLMQIAGELKRRGEELTGFAISSQLPRQTRESLRDAASFPVTFDQWQAEEDAITKAAGELTKEFNKP